MSTKSSSTTYFPTEGNLADAVFAFDPEVVSKDHVVTDFVASVDRILEGSDCVGRYIRRCGMGARC